MNSRKYEETAGYGGRGHMILILLILLQLLDLCGPSPKYPKKLAILLIMSESKHTLIKFFD